VCKRIVKKNSLSHFKNTVASVYRAEFFFDVTFYIHGSFCIIKMIFIKSRRRHSIAHSARDIFSLRANKQRQQILNHPIQHRLHLLPTFMIFYCLLFHLMMLLYKETRLISTNRNSFFDLFFFYHSF
jgi:hypothetical protein